jgi:RNA polymerase sigma factor (sigma-70 family)
MNAQQFGEAYQKDGYRRTVCFLQGRGIGADQANELAQAAWVRGWERISQLQDESRLINWVNAIAHNLLLTGFRQNWLVDLSHVDHEPATLPLVNLIVLDVRQALAKCTPRHQRLLIAFYREGISTRELATQSGRSLEAIHAELYRARKEFSEHMLGIHRQSPPGERVLRMKATAA